MSEATIQQRIQSVIRQLPSFRDASITINDWSRYDLSSELGPLVVISNADDFSSRQDTYTPVTTWTIPVDLMVRNTPDISEALGRLRDLRQEIIDQFNQHGSERGGASGTSVTIDVISNQGPILPVYDVYTTPEDVAQALPLFYMQTLSMTVKEF